MKIQERKGGIFGLLLQPSRSKACSKVGKVVMTVLPVMMMIAMAMTTASGSSSTGSLVLVVVNNLPVAVLILLILVLVVVATTMASSRCSTGSAALVIDEILHMAEVVDAAGDDDCPLLVEAIFLLCLLQQLRKEWVVEVHHRHDEPLLLLRFLPHPHHHATLGRHPSLLLVVAQMWHVQLKAQRRPQVAVVVVVMAVILLVHLVVLPHLRITAKSKNQNRRSTTFVYICREKVG
ncbi:unnamed protein product, partial [Musa hybrid cultivar]